MKSGNPNFLEPSGPLQDCNGTALPFLPLLLLLLLLLLMNYNYYYWIIIIIIIIIIMYC